MQKVLCLVILLVLFLMPVSVSACPPSYVNYSYAAPFVPSLPVAYYQACYQVPVLQVPCYTPPPPQPTYAAPAVTYTAPQPTYTPPAVAYTAPAPQPENPPVALPYTAPTVPVTAPAAPVYNLPVCGPGLALPYGVGTPYPTLEAYLAVVPYRYQRVLRLYFSRGYFNYVSPRAFFDSRAIYFSNGRFRARRGVAVDVRGVRVVTRTRSVTRARGVAPAPVRGRSTLKTKVRASGGPVRGKATSRSRSWTRGRR